MDFGGRDKGGIKAGQVKSYARNTHPWRRSKLRPRVTRRNKPLLLYLNMIRNPSLPPRSKLSTVNPANQANTTRRFNKATKTKEHRDTNYS